jgi:hypothetical protein
VEAVPATRSPRTPAVAGLGVHGRQPRRRFEPQDSAGRLLIRFNKLDVGGPWCLANITQAEHRKMLERLRSIESMTVREAFNNGDEPGKHYPVDSLPNAEAQRRLEDLEYDDETRISRLRFGGKGRLFGFLRDDSFYALWWDPQHEVWPSKKR